MMQDFSRRLRKGNNLWWIAAFAVAGFFVCVGMALVMRYYFLAVTPTSLPSVPVYVYNSPTPILTNPILPTLTLPPGMVYVTATPAPVTPVNTPIPTATATSSYSAYWSWLFPNSRVVPQPTPIQAVVIVPTPTNTQPPPPPAQQTPDPNACKNILYPARPGSQWTYYVNTPLRSGEVLMSVSAADNQRATVDALELNTGATARSYAVCDRDVILDFPLVSGGKLLGRIINGSINADYAGGVLAPNAAAFTASNWALSWIIQYRVYGSGTMQYNGSDFYLDLAPSNMQMTCQTLGAGNAAFETVTVAAGTFNALKVICRGEGTAYGTVNGSQVSGTITAQSTQWFAPNIGLVKLQSDYAYLNVFGISIPLSQSDVAGYIELRNYVIGQ